MQISANKVVTLKYTLSNHSTGEQIEETNETNPLVFLYGVGSLIPEFEQNLADKTTGDAFDFHIIAVNAYGDHDPQHMATRTLPESGETIVNLLRSTLLPT